MFFCVDIANRMIESSFPIIENCNKIYGKRHITLNSFYSYFDFYFHIKITQFLKYAFKNGQLAVRVIIILYMRFQKCF